VAWGWFGSGIPGFFQLLHCAGFRLFLTPTAEKNQQKTHKKTFFAPPVRHTPTTRMEIRTWRSAIADLKGSPPGAPSDALREGTPGWVWRCDAAISRYHQKICLFVRFSRTCSQNTQMAPFPLISKVFGHV